MHKNVSKNFAHMLPKPIKMELQQQIFALNNAI